LFHFDFELDANKVNEAIEADADENNEADKANEANEAKEAIKPRSTRLMTDETDTNEAIDRGCAHKNLLALGTKHKSPFFWWVRCPIFFVEALGLLTDQPHQFSKIQRIPLQFNAPIRSPRQQICFVFKCYLPK